MSSEIISTKGFKDIGKQIEWVAVYENGKEQLPQYNEDGSKNYYPNIDRSRLTQFILLADKKPVVVVHLDSNKKLIYRRRVAFKPFGKNKTRFPVYLVGWQENRRGVNVQSITCYFPDGHVEIIDRFQENHPWFYPVTFRADEALPGQIVKDATTGIPIETMLKVQEVASHQVMAEEAKNDGDEGIAKAHLDKAEEIKKKIVEELK